MATSESWMSAWPTRWERRCMPLGLASARSGKPADERFMTHAMSPLGVPTSQAGRRLRLNLRCHLRRGLGSNADGVIGSGYCRSTSDGDDESRYLQSRSDLACHYARMLSGSSLCRTAFKCQSRPGPLRLPTRPWRQLQHRAAPTRHPAVGILHGCLKTGTTYDETTAWSHHLSEATA